MLPFFHPTSVLIVDDDPTFLGSVQFKYGDMFLCRTEQSPDTALELARGTMPIVRRLEELFTPYCRDGNENPGDRLVQVRTSRVLEIPSCAARFAMFSVAVVDYDMPAMNGVEFCRRIKDIPTRKIMLTGKVGEKTAVDAFNAGLINCFLTKQDKDISKKLAENVRCQQQEFFQVLTAPLRSIIGMADTSFISDPAFAARFEGICRDQRIVEYYVQASPPGVVVITEAGKIFFLAVYDEDSMRAQRETALHADAPPELIRALEQGDHLLVCPTVTGFYEVEYRDTWQHYLWPGERVPGRVDWRIALVPGEAIEHVAASGLVPFALYRDSPTRFHPPG